MNEEKIIEVTDGQRKERIDKFLSHQLENFSRTKVQELIDNNLVLVNGICVKSSYTIVPNDIIKITIIKSSPSILNQPENISLNILFEDDHLLIVNKPAGMVTHPAYGNYTGTLVNALMFHTKKLSKLNDDIRPGIVHRIDKGTSGLLVVAKNESVHKNLSNQFHSHTLEREYHAIAWGRISGRNKRSSSGKIETFLERSKSDRKKFSVSNEGKIAITMYETIEQYDHFTYLKLNLKTGRTHQIRVHLSHLNHPILGDPEYGGRRILSGSPSGKFKAFINDLLELTPFQLLHAKTLGFIHPVTKKMVRFDSELPENFKIILNKIKENNSSENN